MIPRRYIDEQVQIRALLKETKDWEKKYWREFSNEEKSWKTLTIKHLKKFREIGSGNVMAEKPYQKELIEWLKSDEEPKLLYFKTELNKEWFLENEKYTFDSKNITYQMQPMIDEMNEYLDSGGQLDGFTFIQEKKSFWSKLFNW